MSKTLNKRQCQAIPSQRRNSKFFKQNTLLSVGKDEARLVGMRGWMLSGFQDWRLVLGIGDCIAKRN